MALELGEHPLEVLAMADAIRNWYRSITDVRRAEFAPVALMFVYGFLALTSYYLIKPARNSVFLDRVGADNLPYVYILTAVFVTLVILLYSRYVDRVRQIVLLTGTFAFLASNLILFWWLLEGASFMISGAFYIWGKLYPLLLVSQFWLVANVLFTTRQARRLFAPIGLGLILGGFTGSAISGAIATVVGTRTLLSPSAPPIHLVICPFVPSSDSFSFTELVAPVLGKHYRSVGFSGRLTSQWRN